MNRRKEVEPVLTTEDGFLWARNKLKHKKDMPFYQAGVKTLIHGHDLGSGLGSPYSVFKTKDKKPGFSVATLDQEVRKGVEEPDENAMSSLYILG